jgi:hypothetical protein
MKTLKNKIAAITISIFFILSMTTVTSIIPNAKATIGVPPYPTTGWTYAFPAIIGLGQTEFLDCWVSPPPYVSGTYYYNETFIVTSPKGTVTTIVMPQSDVAGSDGTSLVCTEVGNYTVSMTWAGDALHSGCTSPNYTWTVQAAPVNTAPPSMALPERFWEAPVASDYYNWFAITGGWLQNRGDAAADNANLQSAGPTTSHILWKIPVVPGGLIGGIAGNTALEGEFTPTTRANAGITNYVSFNGYIWYTTNVIAENGTQTLYDLHCISLYTGQTLYSVDLDSPSTVPALETNTVAAPPRATLFIEVTGQVKGAAQLTTASVTGQYFLWVASPGLRQIDPTDGATIYYNSSISPSIYDNDCFYYTASGNLTCWSCVTHAVVWSKVGPGITYLYDPSNNGNGILVYTSDNSGGYYTVTTYDEANGTFIANGTVPLYFDTLDTCCANGNIYLSFVNLEEEAISLTTCQVVWTSANILPYPWGEDQAYSASAAYGLFYAGFVNGYVYAWNTTTGALAWKYYTGTSNYTEWGTWPCWGNIVVADGMLYFSTGEHTVTNPIPYGYSMICLNATTGALIWNYAPFCTYTFASVGFGDGIADGILFYQNMYDGCLYAFGQGPSATTVSAPGSGCIAGQPMTITGTVTDQSPGQTTLGTPEQGTPCIADQDQSEWMTYLFANGPLPADATGVPVTLTVTDSNGNQYNIGTTTSNAQGTYGLTFKPVIPGNYTVTATFAGSGAYYGSSSTTYFAASPAATAPTATPVTNLASNTTVEYGIVAIAIIIIVIGAVLAMLVTRKRP